LVIFFKFPKKKWYRNAGKIRNFSLDFKKMLYGSAMKISGNGLAAT